MSDSECHYSMSCPFCGRFPVMVPVRVPRPGMLAMRCQGCDAMGPPKMLPGDAAKAWDEIRFRRRMTDRDLGDDDDDGPEPTPKPVTPKQPELVP